MTHTEFTIGVWNYYLRNMKHQRVGQAFMNYLYEQRPDLHTRILLSDTRILDPFYDDENLPKALDFVAQNW